MVEVRAIDLQLFADRTEPATPRQRQRARERGHVPQSPEVTSAALLLAAFLVLRATAPAIWDGLAGYLHDTLGRLAPGDLSVGDLQRIFTGALAFAGRSLWPLLATVVAVGLAVGFAQVGFIFTLRPLVPQFNRISPLQGWQRMFSRRAAIESLKALFKLILIAWVAYAALRGAAGKMSDLMSMDIGAAVAAVAQLAAALILRVALVWVALAALDYLYQRYEYEVSLRMTRQEIKLELREQEGDPQVKARIRRRQREIAMRRMMADVAKADVVITNPTHYAVALQYDHLKMVAPKVVGKGQGYIAERIKEIARERNIATVENVALAQGLYRAVEVGQTIPPEFYQAVAEVLAFVYRLKGRF